MDISFVVPCYNEEETVIVFYNELEKECSSLDIEYEVIFVDDGSNDNTISKIKELSEKNEKVKYISFSRNFGKEAAMIAGMEKSCGNFVVNVDVDLQDPLNLIKDMYKCVTEDGYDCAGTRRVSRKGEAPLRSFLSHNFYKLMRMMSNIEIVDGARDYRMMSRKMVDAILSLPERNRFSKGIFNWVGFKTKYFEFENIKRTAGTTKWSLLELFMYSLDGIMAFSIMPLYAVSLLGIIFFLVSMFMIVYVIIKTLIYGDFAAGWPSLVCIIFFVSGIQLFCTGVLGQYMAKTYIETKRRPFYIVRETNLND